MNLRKLFTILGILCGVSLVLTACSDNSSKKDSQDSKIKIVTTTNIYADIAKNIVGKYGSATAIIKKSDAEPHEFEPTTADAKELTNANIIIANGLGYDSWMNKLAKSVNKKPVLVGEDLMDLKNGDNPHIWYNLNMPHKYVNYLVKRLSKISPEHANYFKKNGKEYLDQVDKIQKTANKIKNTGSNKSVYVSEPVFDYALKEAGYHIADQDFEEAVENGTDPSAKMVKNMISNIKNRKIAFFVNNTQESSSTVKTFVKLAYENDVPVLNVRETIPSNTTYLDWMTDNYQKLADVSKK